MATTGCQHKDAFSEDDLYQVEPRTIAERGLTGITPDYGMCRRCMVMLAAKEKLNLNRDFMKRSEVLRREREVETRRHAFATLVEWVERLELLPDLEDAGGKPQPPMIDGKNICRVDAEPLQPNELFVLDSKLIRGLHPDLAVDSTRANSVLEKKALCKRHFQELTSTIDSINGESSLPPILWAQGKTYHSLADIFSKSARRDYRRTE